MTYALDAQNMATIRVLLEDARRRFDHSPRMVRRIERALISLRILECAQLIDSITESNPIPASLRRQAH
jgi:hypothetical protein